ncbi:ribosome maturation factor RimM [Solimicrobium silvestre]|uniref:ribosome maturation factor RimM n=1 Tax=Solimicrobium silvestre TaxID=2099400 RepID=UPI001FAF01E1|nr:ribosome maturation factor RimM [Solimicrobium silvestre]
MATPTPLPADLISVGHITGAYGVQGWVRIHPYSAEADALLHAKTWWLGKPEVRSEAPANVHDVEKLEAKRHGDDVVARLMGVVGRDAAEGLKGTVVQISRSHFPVLSNNEFYWLDLIGLAVENLQGESLGVVADLIDNGAHPILRVVQSNPVKVEINSAQEAEVVPAAAREYLIPFVERFVPNVDQQSKKITVDWGLDY